MLVTERSHSERRPCPAVTWLQPSLSLFVLKDQCVEPLSLRVSTAASPGSCLSRAVTSSFVLGSIVDWLDTVVDCESCLLSRSASSYGTCAHTCTGEKKASSIAFSPSALWVLGIEFRLLGLGAGTFTHEPSHGSYCNLCLSLITTVPGFCGSKTRKSIAVRLGKLGNSLRFELTMFNHTKIITKLHA